MWGRYDDETWIIFWKLKGNMKYICVEVNSAQSDSTLPNCLSNMTNPKKSHQSIFIQLKLRISSDFCCPFHLKSAWVFLPWKAEGWIPIVPLCFVSPFDMWPLRNASTSKVCPISAAIMAGKLQGFLEETIRTLKELGIAIFMIWYVYIYMYGIYTCICVLFMYMSHVINYRVLPHVLRLHANSVLKVWAEKR